MKRKTTVLVVDDDPRIARFVRLSLAIHGYEVLTATEGEEALALARGQCPDLVVLDMILPAQSRNRKMDGFDLIVEFRRFSNLPVIAMSGDTSLADRARQLGAYDFISKPFNPEELQKTIESALGRTQNLDMAEGC